MMTRREKIFLIVGALCVFVLIAALVFHAFQSNLFYFFSPSQVNAGEAPTGKTFRVAGHVRQGSIRPVGATPRFEISDGKNALPVVYHGTLPDLFSENGGVVVEGRLDSLGVFTASQVLAKHDEQYRPREKP